MKIHVDFLDFDDFNENFKIRDPISNRLKNRRKWTSQSKVMAILSSASDVQKSIKIVKKYKINKIQNYQNS